MSIAAILQAKGAQVHAVPCGTPVRAAADLLSRHRIGAMPVLDGDTVAGILSERDIVHCLATEGAAILDAPVEQAMTAPVITITRQTEVLSALSLITQRRVRHLPVVEGGLLIGIVSIGDLVKFRMDQIEREAAAMLNYIQMA